MRMKGWVDRFLLCFGLVALAVAAVLEVQAAKPSLKSEMSAAEYARCGLHKLSDGELAALEDWIEQREPGQQSKVPYSSPALRVKSPSNNPTVSFNTSTRKFHCPSCRGALQCTRNCIPISKSEALERGGVPCQICGGSCN